MMADTIKVRLRRSPIGTTRRIRETIKGLGLRGVGAQRELKRTPQIEGMLRRLPHLVEEIKN